MYYHQMIFSFLVAKQFLSTTIQRRMMIKVLDRSQTCTLGLTRGEWGSQETQQNSGGVRAAMLMGVRGGEKDRVRNSGLRKSCS